MMPYLLEKSRFGINFFAKRITILLLYMYQVFIFLPGHLHFFMHFFFTFMEHLFMDHHSSIHSDPSLSCSRLLMPLIHCAFEIEVQGVPW